MGRCLALLSSTRQRCGKGVLGFWVALGIAWGVTLQAAEDDLQAERERDYWQRVYSGQHVIEMQLRVTAQSWQKMHPAQAGRGDETEFPYVRGNVVMDGKELVGAGVRFKGNSSYRFSERGLRRPFKIDTNRFVAGQKWFGQTKFNLSNSFKDASLLREKLGYEVFHATGLPTPGVGWVHVVLTIEGQVERRDLGLYVLVEQVNDRWIERNYGVGSRESLLMKPEGMFEWPYLGRDPEAYERFHFKEGKDNRELQQRFFAFLQFCQESDQRDFSRRIGTFLDLENWARYFAANALLVNLDSIVAMPHNYYLLVDQADGLIKIHPWDLNECFGLFTVGASTRDLVRWDIRRPLVMQNRLLDRLFSVKEFQDRYEAEVRKLLAGTFRPDAIDGRVAFLQPKIEAVLQRYGFREEVEQLRAALNATESSSPGFRGGVVGLKYFVRERVASVRRQLDGDMPGVRLEPRRRGGPPGRPPGGPGELPGLAVIGVLDVNRDGVLSGKEIEQAVTRLKRLDQNGDGKLSRDEYERLGRQRNPRPGVPGPPR